uniref:Phosphatase and actin regulator n=1 Tax=Nothobranchius furzeri TaxID=105023 RepID=A0A8C6LNS7_NOTFU
MFSFVPPTHSWELFRQIRSLERARTGNFLKHKLCSRPERSELVRMHILEETQAEPSLQATQMKLKRARLASDLNEKISHRPGPMELVEKKILPVVSGVEELIEGGRSEAFLIYVRRRRLFDASASCCGCPHRLVWAGSRESEDFFCIYKVSCRFDSNSCYNMNLWF